MPKTYSIADILRSGPADYGLSLFSEKEIGASEIFDRKGRPFLRCFATACNLGNLWRRLVLPDRIGNWSLTSLQQRLVKTGGRLVKHARYYWLLLAESHLTKRLFGAMLRRIEALPVPSG